MTELDQNVTDVDQRAAGVEPGASVDYDPLSDEAMVDPRPIYAQLRRHDPVHYLERYDSWALSRFADVWEVCRDAENFSCKDDQAPAAVFFGAPPGQGLSALDPPVHQLRRKLLVGSYTRRAAENDREMMRTLAREVLAEIISEDGGRMEIWGDYASRVTTLMAAHKAGLPAEDAFRIRHLIDEWYHREPGQRGDAPRNVEAISEVMRYLFDLIARAREDETLRRGNLASMLDGEVNGEPLRDDQIASDLVTIMMTASDTTEYSVAGTIYYLAQHPDQLSEVVADPQQSVWAFLETVRYDQPTGISLRRVVNPTVIGGKQLLPGQGVLLLWPSANRDEAEFEAADQYDIHRRPKRSLLFGQGGHRCLGDSMATVMGSVLLEEFFAVVDAYEVDEAGCRRLSNEQLKGFNRVPITYRARGSRR